MSNPFTTKDPLFDIVSQVLLGEKKLTDAELKKREEIAQAMERENPGMDMGKKMAIATAQAKKVAEEVETLDELSQVKLANYVAKAATSLHNNAKEAGQYDDKENANKAFKRYLGIKSAAVRLRGRGELPGKESAIGAYPKMKYKTEEVDLDEASAQARQNKDKKGELEAQRGLKNLKDTGRLNYDTNTRDAATREGRKMAKEVEVNEAEDQQQNLLLRAMAQDPSDLMKMKRALKAGDKALTNPILRQEILKMLDQMMNLTITDKSLLQKTRSSFMKKKQHAVADTTNTEEVQLEAIGAKDKQDEGEYGYEGDMAMSQLRTIIRNCEEMMKVLDKETDLPEWVQSKITLATDYLQTANDYLMSELEEEVEQIDEAKKTTHEDPLITVHKDGRLQAHAHLSTINDIHGTDVKHTAIHAGGAKVKTKYGDNLEYKLSRHHAQGVEESVEQIDELSKGTLGSYVKKAAKDVEKKTYWKDRFDHIANMGAGPLRYDRKMSAKRQKEIDSRHKNIGKAVDRLTKEEVDKDAPFEGGREVKSSKSASDRVKKIAKGMQKRYTKDKK